MRIVLVEDHEIVLEGLIRIMTDAGHEVVGTAATGEQALELLAATPCELVLLDLGLPDGAGTRVTSEIRRRHPELPILVLTMHADENLALEALRAGANGYMLKYGRMKQLLAAVQAVSEGSSYVHSEVAAGVLKRLEGPRNGIPEVNPRELAILELVARGLSNPEIAQSLNFSLGTIKTTVSGLFTRFGVSDRTSLVLAASARGLLPPNGKAVF